MNPLELTELTAPRRCASGASCGHTPSLFGPFITRVTLLMLQLQLAVFAFAALVIEESTAWPGQT